MIIKSGDNFAQRELGPVFTECTFDEEVSIYHNPPSRALVDTDSSVGHIAQPICR